MRKVYSLLLICIFALIIFSGCYWKEASVINNKIPVDTTLLPANSRVMIGEAMPGATEYTVYGPRRKITLNGIEVVNPPTEDNKDFMMPTLIKRLMEKTSVDMSLILIPSTTVEKGYGVLGNTSASKYNPGADGNLMYLNTIATVKQYQYVCARTIYSIYQYGRDGKLMGLTNLSPGTEKCPDRTDKTIRYDYYDNALKWIELNLKAQQ
ncbi:MAG: hypothetical protein Q7U68_02430 [Candidatus Roizmanbacteria bacterium]|nr:hypothetical protein [Candidatus Roizmanbacteria bacterium]